MIMDILNLPNFLKKGGNDSKYFSTTKKGEIHDLKVELNDPKPDRRKDAVKKVIAAMTVGKDVSMLFPDVLKCMQTDILELKKLVYLYLINYAKTNPDLAIMAINTFRKDAVDRNPLIRALAIRTMGCIQVEKITEYLCEPLRRALKDEDPYVRKTAANCVAKLYDISPSMTEEQGFLKLLFELVSDSNPTVVSNAVAALNEISERTDGKLFSVSNNVLTELLAALGECAEWGQVYILDALSTYTPKSSREAESIIERIIPRLQHGNCAVVMGAVKIIVNFLRYVDNPDSMKMICCKLGPPLITLLSCEPELQYVTLRNISLIVRTRPEVLANDVRIFFCRYNDPIYVKMEKLELMVLLCNHRNVEQVLLELKEYAREVDVEFVRKSVRTIGRIAIRLEHAPEKCISVLLDLIDTRVDYVVQECIVVIKDIFRRYPGKYESIIATLCENLETLDEPEAKASMIWILGEYADSIDNVGELLEDFAQSFEYDTVEVQDQILTSVVKLYLKQPESSKELMELTLSLATEHSDDPDIRDRGYIYWRLLSSDPEAARRIVSGEKLPISDDSSKIESPLLDTLVKNLNSVSSIHFKRPETFVKKTGYQPAPILLSGSDSDYDDKEEDSSTVTDNEDDEQRGRDSGGEDLLDLGSVDGSDIRTNDLDFLDHDNTESSSPFGASVSHNGLKVVLNEDGLRVEGAIGYNTIDSQAVLCLRLSNNAQVVFQDFKIQINKNAWGLTPHNVNIALVEPIKPGEQGITVVPLKFDASKAIPENSTFLQTAVKSMATGAVHYFKIDVSFVDLLSSGGKVEKRQFLDMWQKLGDKGEDHVKSSTTRGLYSNEIADVCERLAEYKFFSIATRTVNDVQVAYLSCRPASCSPLLCELTFKQGFDACKIAVRGKQTCVLPLALQSLGSLVQSS